MTSFANTLSLALASITLAAAVALSGSAAYARGGKDVYVQTYQFAKPMHGYSGQSGSYYCDYQRLPNRKCFVNASGTESCKIVSWTLREMCQ
jgi:hypothetical protein